MKMSDIKEEVQGIRQFMKDQLNAQKGEKLGNDNSFIFLEKDTLNRLLNHLLMNAEQSVSEEAHEDSQEKILKLLEQMIADNKNDFEEFITFLKDRP
jgi:hypothetical protein